MATKLETAAYDDHDYKLNNGFQNRIRPRDYHLQRGIVTVLEGHVRTVHGIVEVYSGDGSTSLEFVHGGRVWHRNFYREFPSPHLVTLAKRFANDIVEDATHAG